MLTLPVHTLMWSTQQQSCQHLQLPKSFSGSPDSCNEASPLPFTGIAAWLLTCAVSTSCLSWSIASITLHLLHPEAKISQILLSHKVPARAILLIALINRFRKVAEGTDKSRQCLLLFHVLFLWLYY